MLLVPSIMSPANKFKCHLWILWNSEDHRKVIIFQHVQIAGGCVHPTCLQLTNLQTHTNVRNSSWRYPGRGCRALCSPVMRPAEHTAHCSGDMGSREFQRLLGGRISSRRLSRTSAPDLGPPRKSRKKLQVIVCVLLAELCERFTFFGIVCNMILFCTVKLGYSNSLAATVNLCFVGASTLTPVLVGWFADTCLGRTKVLYLCAFLHFFGNRFTFSNQALCFWALAPSSPHDLHPLSQAQPCFPWWRSHSKISTSTPIT